MKGRPLDPSAFARRVMAAVLPDLSAYFLLTLVLVGAPTLLSDSPVVADDPSAPFALFPVVLLQTLATTVLLHNMLARLTGAPVPLLSSFAPGLRWWPLAFALTLIKLVVVLLGLVLVAPGVFMAVLWIAALPAMMTEALGMGAAMRRSAALTRGSRLALVGPVLAWLALFLVLPQLLLPTLETDGVISRTAAGVDMLFDMAGVLLGAAGMAAAYVELLQIKEPAARASVFD